ncbi:MANSC domain-containing protein 1 [Bufo gargarizans]|uniref:MANSC domain-containing protein 1 n=1 Tax=Bufo gargarizans TaxID=30331 RepID=UPI001CF2B5BD|nr:MANSC domain-containing protein 1 [Bufo gargarizans]
MDICTPVLPYALLLSALLLVAVSGTQQCAPQVIPDMVIDISQAVARGARFTDPLSVISKEECVLACCKQLDVEGLEECNLMVFDARKSQGEPNCYIFHCPTIDSCPLTPSRGVFSYSLWSETLHPEKRDPEKVQQKSSDHSKVQSSPGRTSGSAMHPPSGSTESGPLDLNNKKNTAPIDSTESGPLDLSNKKNSALIGSTESGPLDLNNNKNSALIGSTESGPLDLSNKKNSALIGSTESGPLDLNNKKNSTLIGSTESGPLDLNNNKNSALIGSTESGPLDLNNKKNSALIASQEPAKHVKEEPANSSQKITTQLLHLANTIDQHLEKMESKSAALKDNLQVHFPSPVAATVPTIQATTIPIHGEVKKTLPDAKEAKPGIVTYKMPDNLKIFPTVAAKQVDTVPKKTSLSTAAPKPVHRTKANLIVTSASFQDTSGAHKVPSSDKSAKLPGSDHSDNSGTPMVTPKKVSHPLPHTEVPALATVHQTRPPQMVTHPAPLQTSPRKEIKPSTKTNDQPSASDEVKTPGQTLTVTHPSSQKEPVLNLEESPRKADSTASEGILSSLEDKSGLVAALVFGMLFLLVIIGLISRKVSEVRRRHQYTKLDYLINGMYVDT